MPALPTFSRRLLYLSLALIVPQTALTDEARPQPEDTTTAPDSAWICQAHGERWSCRRGPRDTTYQTADREGISAHPEDNYFRTVYPGSYASQHQVLQTQQLARDTWQQAGRRASNPDGVSHAAGLFDNAPVRISGLVPPTPTAFHL